MKYSLLILASLFSLNILAEPDGYFEAASNEKGEKWFMHYKVQIRNLKENPKDKNVLADIWFEGLNGYSSGSKQAYNCDEPGAAFQVIPNEDGGLSRNNPTYYVTGTIGYSLWQFACTLAYPQTPSTKKSSM